MLQESLRSARRAAQVPPLGVQLAQCEQFVTPQKVKHVCSGCESKQLRGPRKRSLRHQWPPPDWAAELQRLQSLVSQLQEERIQLGPRLLEEELQDLRWEVDALRHERDSLVAERGSVGPDTTMAVVPSSDRMAALIEEGEMKRRKMEAALTTT